MLETLVEYILCPFDKLIEYKKQHLVKRCSNSRLFSPSLTSPHPPTRHIPRAGRKPRAKVITLIRKYFSNPLHSDEAFALFDSLRLFEITKERWETSTKQGITEPIYSMGCSHVG